MVCLVQLLFNNVFQASVVSQWVNTKVSYQSTSETKGKHYQITNCSAGRKFTVNVYEAAIYCCSKADILRCISSYIPSREICKRMVFKRLQKRKPWDPWHIVMHGFYFAAISFSFYPSHITAPAFQRGLGEERGSDMITTTKFQVYINKTADMQAFHSSIQKSPFHLRSRLSVYYTAKYFTDSSNNHNNLMTDAVPLLPVHPCLV